MEPPPTNGIKICVDTEGQWSTQVIGKPPQELTKKVKDELNQMQVENASKPTVDPKNKAIEDQAKQQEEVDKATEQ